MENLNCPICDERGMEETCGHCGFEIVRCYIGLTEETVRAIEKARIEEARMNWASKTATQPVEKARIKKTRKDPSTQTVAQVVEKARVEVNTNPSRQDHRHELKYRVESKRPYFRQKEPLLLVHITTPVSPALQLPATVLVGHKERLPTSPQDGVELYRWPMTAVGPEGGLLTAPLTILQGQVWSLRLFLEREQDAALIRLIHGNTKEMTVA